MTNYKNLVSVVICAFSSYRFDMTVNCINSIINNTYKNWEIILVIDGNEELKERMISRFKEINYITIIGNKKNEGASVSRNIGIREAKGEIIAFIDDDGFASSDWIECIVKDFNEYKQISVIGGKLLPVYEDISRKLPEEILWIVGGTYKGHPEKMQKVRNVFTGNMAVRKSVFDNINFEIMYDKKETFLSYELSHQLEDTLFCVRFNDIRPNEILYDPAIVAYHHVPKSKINIKYIVKEGFFEGVLKAKLEYVNKPDKSLHKKETLSSEHHYLSFIIISIIKNFSTLQIRNAILLLLTMMSVSVGYTSCIVKERYIDRFL